MGAKNFVLKMAQAKPRPQSGCECLDYSEFTRRAVLFTPNSLDCGLGVHRPIGAPTLTKTVQQGYLAHERMHPP